MDTAQHSTGRRGRARRQTAARSPPPARHHGKIRRTIHYCLFYTSRKRKGVAILSKGWDGVLEKPRWVSGTRGQRVSRGRSMHKEALGDFNQALATRGRTGGLGSGLHREGMAPAR